MFELFILFVVIVDCMVIGKLIAMICTGLFGDTPGARLVRLILVIAGAIGYGYMCLNLLFEDTESGLGIVSFAVFAPVALLLILKVIDYMFSGNNENKD